MYFGGKNGDKIYFGKPVIYDNENPHYMFPNEARLRNMNYSMTIHYDIEIEFIDILEDGQKPYIVDVNMIGGNDGGYKGLEIEDTDYSEERNRELENKIGDFKKQTFDAFNEEQKQPLDVENDNMVDGGAPKKVERKKRVKSVEVEMTTGMAEKIREISEKSLIGSNIQKREIVLEKIFLGKFPIMVQSDFCILNGLPREVKYSMGECKNDLGGYFIIDGKEKTVVPQEKFADNMLYIREVKDDKYLYSAEIKSVSENVSKPIRTLSVKIKSPSPSYTFENIEVNIPNVRNPVPLFILFRALGVISDKEIIKMCLLDLEKYESMIDLFRPSVHDAASIMTQQNALLYIASLTKYNTVTYVLEILSDYFLPHVGEINYI
jgi:DNA-directed RNA polymerase beta subunit